MDTWMVSHVLQLQAPWAVSLGANMQEMLSPGLGWNCPALGCVPTTLYQVTPGKLFSTMAVPPGTPNSSVCKDCLPHSSNSTPGQIIEVLTTWRAWSGTSLRCLLMRLRMATSTDSAVCCDEASSEPQTGPDWSWTSAYFLAWGPEANHCPRFLTS